MSSTEIILNLESVGSSLNTRRKYYVPTNVLIGTKKLLDEHSHNPRKVFNRLVSQGEMVYGSNALVTGRLIYDLIYAMKTLPE